MGCRLDKAIYVTALEQTLESCVSPITSLRATAPRGDELLRALPLVLPLELPLLCDYFHWAKREITVEV
jgi:hypothetical protein